MASKQKTLSVLLKINYKTSYGDSVFVSGTGPFGDWNDPKSLTSKQDNSGDWELSLSVPIQDQPLSYKYYVVTKSGEKSWEGGQNRELITSEYIDHKLVEIRDIWMRTNSPEATYLDTSLFREVVFHRDAQLGGKNLCAGVKDDQVIVRFDVLATVVSPQSKVYVVGSNDLLGNWDHTKALALSESSYPHWRGQIAIPKAYSNFTYKYCIFNPEGAKSSWETGPNRVFSADFNLHPSSAVVLHDGDFRTDYQWRGSGVAAPVFSLRTKSGLGVGEFLDIKLLVDWAAKCSLNMIQILPISDTTVFGDYRDSYPYSAVSVFALHPLYARIESITNDPAILKEVETRRTQLNKLAEIDFVEVIKLKTSLLRRIFETVKGSLTKDSQFQEYLQQNQEWLEPYALFSHFRDKFGTYEFPLWPEHKTISKAKITELASPQSNLYPELLYHYFVQYHLHKQLSEASAYAKANRVGLKGDLPIGVNRYSVDTWVNPLLFKMDKSTGAPPDAFADDGQNWGFPTYNWDEMAKDNYAWWRARLGQMAKYFHAFRIDHILGFFRIWEIPGDSVTGLLGRFNPSEPLHIDELRSSGFWDFERLTQPYIRSHLLHMYFGDKREYIEQKFLQPHPTLFLKFKPEYDSEKKIVAALQGDDVNYKQGLFRLLQNVCLLKEGNDKFYPRIELQKTTSYQELDLGLRASLNRLYIAYFFERQEYLWSQIGLKRLPVIRSCTKMLVCGEDLGMVPKCVPPVLEEIGILGLRIQRMPADAKIDFYNPSTYPYLTVCATSSHDTSTLRGWWEEDRVRSQSFYNSILALPGTAPYFCETYVTQSVLHGHFNSPSMWAIIPLQDLFGLDPALSSVDPKLQRINEPSNPLHYWRYRFHVGLEELLNNSEFDERLKFLSESSGRKAKFM